jgi:CBS domain-containing protein
MASTALTARDVMTTGPVCAKPGMSIRELAALFGKHRISGAPVVNPDGTLAGVVSKTDLFKRCAEGTGSTPARHLFDLLEGANPGGPSAESLIVVSDFMVESVVTAAPGDPVAVLAAAMVANRVHRVVVIDGERRPVGIVTTLDLLKRYR